MHSLASLRLRLARLRLHLPAAALITLLQRTPVVRVAAAADEFVAASPLGTVLKSAAAAIASLGAVHSLAGATVLVASQSSPVSTKVGTSGTSVAFTVTNTINIASWKIGGTLPPGMTISATQDPSKVLTGPGMLDATGGGTDDGYGGLIGGISSTTPVLSGTPTTAGNYTFTLQAYEFAGLAGLASNSFSFTVNVAAADVTPVTVAPAFTTQPQGITVNTGAAITLTAAASGTPAPTFQWNKNGVPISGATSATLTIASAQTTDAGTYTVTVTNGVGSPVTSSAAVVTVNAPVATGVAASFTQAPLTQSVVPGATVALNVTVTGTPVPTLQWRKDGVAINGATKASLILTGVTAANAGSYTVVATNGVGNPVTSGAGTLTVASNANFGHLTNLAIFATLTTSTPDFTVATVIGGGSGGAKPLLIRAVGPALGQLGVGGFVVDPKADLFAGSTLTASNDNWGDGGNSTALSAAFASVGAFSYAAATSKDAAIFLPAAAPGSYSVKVSGVGGATGLVLAELYDAQPSGTFSATSPRFLDVSVLKQIDSTESLTVGFNLAGATSRTVLIRAVGPALAALGVGGTMPDPQLDLYSGSTVLASNDNWGGDPQINAAFQSVGAFGFSQATSKDAVIIATLAPGNYTAVVKGVNGSAGLTLVEVYDVP
jgi:hypothetical protein